MEDGELHFYLEINLQDCGGQEELLAVLESSLHQQTTF